MNRLRHTHMLVYLPISKPAYNEIRSKLVDSDYSHCILDDLVDNCEGLDMQGIALVAVQETESKKNYVCAYSDIGGEYAVFAGPFASIDEAKTFLPSSKRPAVIVRVDTDEVCSRWDSVHGDWT